MSRILFLASLLGILTGCGSSSPTAGGNGAGNIAIKASLASARIQQALWDRNYLIVDRERGALSGYQLYCVTFTNPTASGKGTAATDGSVTVTLAAAGVPFGCFILDTSGNQVATLSFKAASTTGSAVNFSADIDVGTISVSSQTGLAQVTLTDSQTGSIVTKTPSGLACPLGLFTTNLDKNACLTTSGSFTGTASVTQGSDGVFHVGLVVPNAVVNHGPPVQCATVSFNSKGAPTFANNVLTFTQDDNNSGCAKTDTLAYTFNTDCTGGTMRLTIHGCGHCDYSQALVEQCKGCPGQPGESATGVDCIAGTDASTPHDFPVTLVK